MSKISELFEELDSQKRKYHEKELSVDGEWSLILRTLQVYDLIFDISEFIIPEYFYSSLIGSLLFGFDLSELEPLNLEFTWRLPDLEEWLRGISIVFEKVLPDYVIPLEDFIKSNIKQEYQPEILPTLVEKGYYGKSRYGESYYDPTAVREFLRASLTAMFKKHPTLVSRRLAIDSLTKVLDLNPEVVRMVHDRISMITASHTGCFILDYGILDHTYLCEEATHSEELGVVEYVDYDGQIRRAEVLTLADMQFGCILDVTILDYCFLMPDEDIYNIEVKPIIDALDIKLRRFRDRIIYTGHAFSNYVRGDEAADYIKCERTEVWGELMSLRYVIESEVDGLVSSIVPELNNFDRRKYTTAVLQLLGHIGKRHKWGYNVFKTMEEPQLRSWWLGYWGSQGLDLNILEKLYDMVKVWLPQIVKRKVGLGRSLRLRRLGIPL